jgi:hypothetical protein
MNDLTLLQWFAAGDASLESNKNLRVQPTGELRQLFTHKGMLLATAHDGAFPPYISLRMGTKYTPVLHETLLEHDFISVTGITTHGCRLYEFHPVPAGFAMHCESARQLWKKWRQDRQRFLKQKSSFVAQVLMEGEWREIQQISLNQSTLYIDVLVNGVTKDSIYQSEDQIIWIEEEEEGETTVFFAGLPPTATQQPAFVQRPAPTEQSAAVQQPTPAPRPVPAPQPATPQPVPAPRPETYLPSNAKLRAEKGTHGPIPANSAKKTADGLNQVVQQRNGKLYIQTAIGRVVISGDNLNYALSDPQPSNGATATTNQVMRQPNPLAS